MNHFPDTYSSMVSKSRAFRNFNCPQLFFAWLIVFCRLDLLQYPIEIAFK